MWNKIFGIKKAVMLKAENNKRYKDLGYINNNSL